MEKTDNIQTLQKRLPGAGRKKKITDKAATTVNPPYIKCKNYYLLFNYNNVVI